MGRGQKRLERDEGQSHVEDRNHGLIRRKRTFAVQLYCTAFQGLYRLPRPLRPHADMVTFAIADLISHLWSTSTTVRVLVGWLFNVQTSFALLLFHARVNETHVSPPPPTAVKSKTFHRERKGGGGDMQRTRGFEWEDGGGGRGRGGERNKILRLEPPLKSGKFRQPGGGPSPYQLEVSG